MPGVRVLLADSYVYVYAYMYVCSGTLPAL